MKLTKFDVLLYLEANEGTRKFLAGLIRKNIKFEKASDRTINVCARELKKEKFIVEKNRKLKINRENKKTDDCLAFLHWSRMRSVDYNLLMSENVTLVFKEILGGCIDLRSLSKKTLLSKPTLLKTVNILSQNNFLSIEKKKPLIMKANLNDLTFFYINFHEFSLENFEKRFSIPKFQKIRSKKLTERLIKLHAYSTTVTEGNTATEEDVEKLFGNYPVNLTPHEIAEILNTKKAVELLYEIRNEEIEISKIKNLHKILMFNLLDKAGEFHYRRKRIIGSELKPPESREEVYSSLNSLSNFINRYEHEISPVILASLAHFIFVTIHPFADGNGRMARLLHSWIHLKNDLPLFVFDPNRKTLYFDALETGRNTSIDDFIVFCLEGMYEVLDKLTRIN